LDRYYLGSTEEAIVILCCVSAWNLRLCPLGNLARYNASKPSKDSKMNEANEVQANEVAAPTAPEGFLRVVSNLSFRRFKDTTENRAKQTPSKPDHEIVLVSEAVKDENGKETGEKVFKRATESYPLLVPLVTSLGLLLDAEDPQSVKQETVMQSFITDAIAKEARKLVNEGKLVTDANCNWDIAMTAVHESITAGGATYSKELLDDVCARFSKYMTAIGKPVEGIEITCKMIRARFNKMSTYRMLKALPAVQHNVETWLTDGLDATEQANYLPVTEYLIDRIEKAQEPEEEVDTASMF